MTEAHYRFSLRAPVRALWLSVFDFSQFVDAMFLSVQRGFTRAWNQGLADVGLKPEDQTQEERTELARRILSQVEFIGRFGGDIEAGSKANKGLLRVQFRRVEKWVGRYTETRMAARAMAGANKPLKWEINPVKENCFLAGTMVETVSGKRPIESIAVGDYVQTINGPRIVTRTYKDPYSGKMIRVSIGDKEIFCTPGHPFLTKNRGWVEAKDLRTSDYIVLSEYANNRIFNHIAVPNSNDNVSASPKVFILGLIPSLLSQLPFSKRLMARMAMPIFPIRLDNEISDSYINDEFGFDKKKWLMFNSKFIKNCKHFQFKFGWIALLVFLFSFGEIFQENQFLCWVGVPILFDFFYYLLSKHWIIICHALFRNIIDKLFAFFRQESQLENSYSIQHLFVTKSNLIGNISSTKGWIIIAKKLIKFISPQKSLIHVLNAKGAIPWTYMPALRTGLITLSSSNISNLKSIIPDISTSNRTKPANWIGRKYLSLKWLFTQFTNKFLYHSSNPQLDVLYHKNEVVYNLEVDIDQHYFANGFIVHNCTSCLRLNGKVKRALYWQEKGVLPQVPDAPYLICKGYNCGCGLNPTTDPLSRGPLPKLP